VTAGLSEVRFHASDELLDQLEKIKGLLSHSHPHMTTGELIAYLARLGLERLDPAAKKLRSSAVIAENIPSEDWTADEAPIVVSSSAQNDSPRHSRLQTGNRAIATDAKTKTQISSKLSRKVSRRPPAHLIRQV
jgi:hypothetical protein